MTELPLTDEGNITVMAVDNLPCELARDASQSFGKELISNVLPPLLGIDTFGIIARATVAEKGRLSDRYNYLKDYANTWKTKVYNKGGEISLYNADTYKDNETKQQFFPVGSVWRGTEEKSKPKGANRTPASINSCGIGHGLDASSTAKDEGPEKETILVSGDVKHPEKFDVLWKNTSGCNECQTYNINIYTYI